LSLETAALQVAPASASTALSAEQPHATENAQQLWSWAHESTPPSCEVDPLLLPEEPPLDDVPLLLPVVAPESPRHGDAQLLSTHDATPRHPVLSHDAAALQVVSSDEQLESMQLVHSDESVFMAMIWKSERGLGQPPPSVVPLLEPAPLLEPPPSSPSLLASPNSLPPPLLFELQATAALSEPTITAVHATALTIRASVRSLKSAQYAGGRAPLQSKPIRYW
jgi:hypothetical protein